MTAPIGVYAAGTSNSSRNVAIRSGGMPKKHAPSPSSTAVWRISSWHKNQHLMQLGAKTDQAGWGVYEESRRAGAIAATAHEHSYCRTHLLSSMENQTIASTAEPCFTNHSISPPDAPSADLPRPLT